MRDATPSARALDNAHVMHPWEGMESLGDNARTQLASGSGIHVRDETGRPLIDGPGGMWCMQLGYGRADMAEAMAEQARQLAYYSPFTMANPEAGRLAAEIAARTPGDLNRVFFTTGGSTAVDTAIRFIHFRNNLMGRPEKKIVLSRARAYHGSTYLSASVSGKERDRLWLDKADELVRFLPDVDPSRRPEGQSVEAFCDAKVADLEAAILDLGPDRVAAFIAEPILASGGVIVPPPGYHARCLELCRRHDVLYISDEVVTGFGRLGHWFASQEVFGIVPDIITTAKGLTSGYAPMGAAILSEALFDDIAGRDAVFSNGYTWSGHPVSVAAALKSMEIIEREGILAHVRAVSPQFQARLSALAALPGVTDARGMGLMGCVECATGNLGQDYDIGQRIDRECQARGLLVRPLINMCVVSPPLVITPQEIDRMFDILEEGLRAALG